MPTRKADSQLYCLAMNPSKLPEPWLRGTLTEVDPVLRAVLHALELAKEDLEKWCGDLSDEELNALPAGLDPVAFHLRHVAGSIDRLLTYAENQPLSVDQITRMKLESEPGANERSCSKRSIAAWTQPQKEFGNSLRNGSPKHAAWGGSACQPHWRASSFTWPTIRSGTWGRQ